VSTMTSCGAHLNAAARDLGVKLKKLVKDHCDMSPMYNRLAGNGTQARLFRIIQQKCNYTKGDIQNAIGETLKNELRPEAEAEAKRQRDLGEENVNVEVILEDIVKKVLNLLDKQKTKFRSPIDDNDLELKKLINHNFGNHFGDFIGIENCINYLIILEDDNELTLEDFIDSPDNIIGVLEQHDKDFMDGWDDIKDIDITTFSTDDTEVLESFRPNTESTTSWYGLSAIMNLLRTDSKMRLLLIHSGLTENLVAKQLVRRCGITTQVIQSSKQNGTMKKLTDTQLDNEI
jgi:hypothetical protein